MHSCFVLLHDIRYYILFKDMSLKWEWDTLLFIYHFETARGPLPPMRLRTDYLRNSWKWNFSELLSCRFLQWLVHLMWSLCMWSFTLQICEWEYVQVRWLCMWVHVFFPDIILLSLSTAALECTFPLLICILSTIECYISYIQVYTLARLPLGIFVIFIENLLWVIMI